MRRINILFLAVLLTGCSVGHYVQRINDAESSAKQDKWKDAYSYIEYSLIFNYEPENLKELLGKYPKIVTVGMRETFKERLIPVTKNCNNSEFFKYFHQIKNLGNNQYAGETKKTILDDSRTSMDTCAAKRESGVWLSHLNDLEKITGPDYFTQSTKEQAAITEELEKKDKAAKAKDRTGIIVSAQVANESHVNTGTGASLGAAYGQAQYIDNANWRNYSATKQLGAGLAGAVIGGILMDKPSKPSYRSTYFVKLHSGDIKQVEVVSDKATHYPEGVCVEALEHDLTLVNQNNCAGLKPNP